MVLVLKGVLYRTVIRLHMAYTCMLPANYCPSEGGGRGAALGKLTGCDCCFTTWFDHLGISISYKKIQFKRFCPPEKTSGTPAENVT